MGEKVDSDNQKLRKPLPVFDHAKKSRSPATKSLLANLHGEPMGTNIMGLLSPVVPLEFVASDVGWQKLLWKTLLCRKIGVRCGIFGYSCPACCV